MVQKWFQHEGRRINIENSLVTWKGLENYFLFGVGTNVSAMENETLEQQTKGRFNDFERIVDSANQHQVIRECLDETK